MSKRCDEEAQSLMWKTLLLALVSALIGYFVYFVTVDWFWVYMIAGVFFIVVAVIVIYWYAVASKTCRAG